MPYDISQFSPGYGGTINSSGNVVNIADTLDESTGQFKPPAMKEFTFQSGATAIGNGTAADVSGYATLIIQVTISAVATVAFEVSLDGTNYFSVSTNSPNATGGSQNTTNAAGTSTWRFSVAGFKFFRARISSYGSGTVNIIGYASTASFAPQYLTTQAGSSDTNSTTNILQAVGAYNLLYDGTNWVRQRSAVALADSANSLAVNAMYGYNGTAWDRVRTANIADGSASTGLLANGLFAFSGSGWDRVRTATFDNGSATGLLANHGYGFTGTGFDRVRVGKVYKYIEYLSLANATATTVWTPSSGKKFRLMGVQISVSTAAQVSLRDGTAGSGTPFHMVKVAVADTIDFSFGNGYLSSVANNVLEIYNATGSSVSVWVTAWGTEE